MTEISHEWHVALRDELPVLSHCVYLNTGTAGPTPRCSMTATEAEMALELSRGRGDFSTFDRIVTRRQAVRTLVARLLGASSDQIALMHHTSEGINAVLASFDWQAGDQVVTTSLEHDAVIVPLGLLRTRRGVDLGIAEIGHGQQAIDGLQAALTDRTRLVVLSHIVYSTGALLPLAEMIAQCHERGVQVLVDGAQTVGVLPLDVVALGVDYYTVSGQKWLCGPEGTGALYLRQEHIDDLVPAYTSYFSTQKHDFRGEVTLHPDARRFETGMLHRPSLTALEASLSWIIDEVRVERAWRRSLELAAYCRQRLQSFDQVVVITPESQSSPLVAFDLPHFSPAALHSTAHWLAENALIVCRSIDHPPYALRISLGFFNTREEIDRMIDALDDRLRAGPDASGRLGWADQLPDHR